LVVVPDIWGLRLLFNDMCESLAERTGWSVGAFEPFPGQELPGAEAADGLESRSIALRSLSDADLLGDAAAVADLLGEQPCGLIGFCMGGMYALKGAGHGRFDRVAAFYGMIRVPDGWSGPGHGQPLDAIAAGSAEVMAIVGTADAWTPTEDCDALEGAGAEVVRYEGADHGFVHDPTRPTHRADYAEDAWNRVLEFLGA
jgi:carboxymethylenebutenolidase